MATGAPDHYKTMLLAGLYDGQPVLAYIDTDGRFVMRIEDIPDIWGETVTIGLGELTAILTTAKRYDRRGSVFYYDDFEDGLIRLETGGAGTGWSVTSDTTRARSKAKSVKLTAGSDGLHYAQITAYFPLYSFGKIGVEVSFTLDDDADDFDLELMCTHPSYQVLGRIRYDASLEGLFYLDENSVYQGFALLVYIERNDYIFNTMKLVLDAANKRYDRFMLNGQTWDLSDKNLALGPAGDPYYGTAIVMLEGLAGTNSVSFVDDLILTHNEP